MKHFHITVKAAPVKLFTFMATMLLTGVSISTFAQSNEILKGDINEDGVVDVADIANIINIMANGEVTLTRYFYLGTTKPTVENYKTLPGVVTSYTSIDDAVGTTVSIAAGETLYMLCPLKWTYGKIAILEDEAGETFCFSEPKDSVTISGYAVYSTPIINDEKNVVFNAETTDYKEDSTSYWKGKTIWWCGTSIPAGGYPQIVGANLGATVINKAVGGSMCRANVRTGDYHGAVYENITSALCMTKAEIDSFISNYATLQPYLVNAPAEMSTAYINKMRTASFEDRLLPYLNGTYNMPDLFVIDHGHNDFKYKLADFSSDINLEPTRANITAGTLAEDTYMTGNDNEKLLSFFDSLDDIAPAKRDAFICSLNRNCYIGAVNFIVTLILHYNPKARIAFISNYEYEHGDNPNYAPLIVAQETNAASWAFPLCEVYKYLGFSNHIIPGTKNIYSSYGRTFSEDIDVFKIYCPDGVHPHSDPTGDANRIYAGILTEFIKTIR